MRDEMRGQIFEELRAPERALPGAECADGAARAGRDGRKIKCRCWDAGCVYSRMAGREESIARRSGWPALHELCNSSHREKEGRCVVGYVAEHAAGSSHRIAFGLVYMILYTIQPRQHGGDAGSCYVSSIHHSFGVNPLRLRSYTTSSTSLTRYLMPSLRFRKTSFLRFKIWKPACTFLMNCEICSGRL